jgi:hypothetical protein
MLAVCFLADRMKVPPSTIWKEWSDEDMAFMLAYYKFQGESQEAEAKRIK